MVVSVFSLGGICGRLLSPVGKRLSLREETVVRVGSLLCGLGGIALFFARDLSWVFAGVAAISSGYGISYSTMPVLMANQYGDTCFTKVYSIFTTILQIGCTLGPISVLALSDLLKGYSGAFLALSIISLAGALMRGKPAARQSAGQRTDGSHKII